MVKGKVEQKYIHCPNCNKFQHFKKVRMGARVLTECKGCHYRLRDVELIYTKEWKDRK
jgi:hypothetical protein